MTNNKPTDRTQTPIEKKYHLKFNQPGSRNPHNSATIKQKKAESGLNKQLPNNFQTKKLCKRKQLKTNVKNGVVCKTKVYLGRTLKWVQVLKRGRLA